MKSILKSASRLIVVFILTMIISGGILTYLSINSIATFRELTEKKVAEEQLFIADQISATLLQNLEQIACQFSALVFQEEELVWDAVKQSDTLRFVENPFVISPSGEFLWPWYLDEMTMGTGSHQSPMYRQHIELAQRAEFQDKKYRNALLHYQRSLHYVSGKSDSANSINAIGRVSMKMQEFATAYSSYSRIASDFPSVLDSNGFPYVYYAILNLLEIGETVPEIHVNSEIGSFLDGMTGGTVPMNYSTADILARIPGMWGHSVVTDHQQFANRDESISKIERNLGFISNYSKTIKTSLREQGKGQFQPQLGEFLVLRNPVVNPGRIVLIHPWKEHFPGFCMDLDSLWSGLMTTDFSKSTEFEYTVSLTRKDENGVPRNGKMVTSGLLSSFFPAYEILVDLGDEYLIDTFVRKRHWTYGIALFLLLGAMFLGILLILRDLLREKNLNRLRSDFVSNVTHELKTPLTSIHLFAESVLLDRVNTPAGQKEYMQIILKETERLKRMINNILDFSKKEKGKVPYKSESVHVSELIRSALKDLNYWLKEMEFTVHTDLEEGIRITGDRDAIKQVIINLLDNAIKYSRDQKEIRIRLVSEDGIIRIGFSDKGIGIPGDQLSSIFDKFYRVNDSRKDGIGGTGLGLTVVKEIIEAHQGEIMVESEPNKGSTFTVLLKKQ